MAPMDGYALLTVIVLDERAAGKAGFRAGGPARLDKGGKSEKRFFCVGLANGRGSDGEQ